MQPMLITALRWAGLMKRRVVIFCLLGPVLSCLVLAVQSRSFRDFWVVAVPVTVVVVSMSLLLCALIDFYFEDERLWERVATAAISGFISTFLAAFLVGATFQNIRTLQIGLVGAIPAVICSLLSSLRSWRLCARID